MQIRRPPTGAQGRRHFRANTGVVRGKFPSRKNARMVFHRGLLELDAIYLFETSPLIESYRERPVRVLYPDGGQLRGYTPPFEVALRGGEKVLVELQYARPAQHVGAPQEPAKSHRRERLAAHLLRSGTRWIALTDLELRGQPRLTVLKDIYRQAPRNIPTAHAAAAAVASIQAFLPERFDVVALRLAPTGVDIYSLLLGGFLTCSLDAPLTRETSIHLSKEAGHDWFYVSQQHGF
jgi:hypothetical protein